MEKITTVSVPMMSGARTAKINIISAVGRLDLSGKELSGLVEGRLVSNFMEIHSKSDLEGNIQKVSLEEKSLNLNSSMSNNLTLNLNRTIPMDISLRGAVSDMNIDLSTVAVNNIDISSGASSLKLKLGNKMKTSTVNLNAGTGSTDISIPEGTGVLLRVNSGLSTTSFKNFNKVSDKVYRSENYEASDKKIDLNINVGLSSLDISWYPEIRLTDPENNKTVELFYYNRLADKDSSCGSEYILPLKRQIPTTQTPIKDAINLLISGQLTSTEKEQGFLTEFPNPGFKLLDANYDYDSETLALRFTEVPGFTDGGSCRVGILANEIIKTAKQFGVKNVVFIPESLFQP
jgi:hypothetical protein